MPASRSPRASCWVSGSAPTPRSCVVNAVLLQPLPYPDPSRLVIVWHVPPADAFPGCKTFAVSAANYIDWEKQNHVFEKMAVCGFTSLNLTGSGAPEAVTAARVSPDFFSVLGTRPALGRTFTPAENVPGENHVVRPESRLLEVPLRR